MHEDLEQLDAITGVWSSEGETIAHENETPISIKGIDAYEWVPGKQYIIHRIDVAMGEDDVYAVEIIGGYDETKKAFAMNAFQNDAGHSVMWASKNNDGTWLFAGNDMRAILTPPTNEHTMNAKWERREGSEWVHWMNVRFTRQPSIG